MSENEGPIYELDLSSGRHIRVQVYQGDCSHLGTVADVTPSGDGCKECLEIGSAWVHLRLCMTCGHVGCCDESPNTHATKHVKETEHPVVQSYEPDEDWLYCYPDDVFVEVLED